MSISLQNCGLVQQSVKNSLSMRGRTIIGVTRRHCSNLGNHRKNSGAEINGFGPTGGRIGRSGCWARQADSGIRAQNSSRWGRNPWPAQGSFGPANKEHVGSARPIARRFNNRNNLAGRLGGPGQDRGARDRPTRCGERGRTGGGFGRFRRRKIQGRSGNTHHTRVFRKNNQLLVVFGKLRKTNNILTHNFNVSDFGLSRFQTIVGNPVPT